MTYDDYLFDPVRDGTQLWACKICGTVVTSDKRLTHEVRYHEEEE